VTVTGANGCTNTATATTTSNKTLPTVNAGTYGPVCADAADINLVGSPAGGVWSGLGVSGNSFDPSVGTQTLTYTYTNVNGCVNTAITNITVNSISTLTITNPNSVISPATVNITLPGVTVGSTSGLVLSYWTNSSTSTSYSTPATATAGTYYIKGVTVGGCIAIKPVTVIVNQPPVAGCDSIIWVSNLLDDDSDTTLRKAIARLCNNGTIRFNLDLDCKTILLTKGTLVINKNIIFDNTNHLCGVTIGGPGTNITIQPGVSLTLKGCSKFTVTGTIVNNAGVSGLVLNSCSSLIYNYCDLPATAKRDLNAGWHLFGSPFVQNTGAALAKLIPSAGSAQLMPYTNGVNWGSTVTSPYFYFAPSVGYAVKPSAAITAVLTGNLFCVGPCEYSVPLVYKGTLSTQSWNLLANPYPSYLNWNLLGKTNVNTSLYLWDNSLYPLYTPVTNAAYFRTYNSANNVGVPAGTSRYIAPFQGFFVRGIYTNPRISFPLSARTHTTSTFYKDASSTEILLRLKTECELGADELVICKNPDAQLDYDVFDSEKLFNDLPVEIYSQAASGEKLVINTINTTQTIIPLGIHGKAGTKAKITAFALESGEQVYLEDRFKAKLINLTENTTYSFDFPTDVVYGRFFIRFGNPNTPLIHSDINVFEKDNQLNIVAQSGEELQNVEVFSLTGARVYKAEMSNTNMFTNELHLAPAIYMVRVKTSIATQNVKISWK
ncbi:MAG: T9SS type A sorting domain-containing protein, partial [Bacteroidales bacterium]